MHNYASEYSTLLSEYKNKKTPIDINFRKLVSVDNFDRLTHYIHSYPAKLLQCIPLFFLSNSTFSQEGDLVYDPFCGSGTVPLETAHLGRIPISRDINPFACLLTKVKLTFIDDKKIGYYIDIIENEFNTFAAKDHGIRNQDYWYRSEVYEKLSSIYQCIMNLGDQDIVDFFRVCFSTTARKMSLADPRISVPVRLNPEKYPSNHKLRIAAEKKLESINAANVIKTFRSQAEANRKRVATLKDINTRCLLLENENACTPPSSSVKNKVDLVVTSPPYPGAQKYIRACSLSLRWLELSEKSLTPLKKQIIGREEVTQVDYTGSSSCANADKQIEKIAEKHKERAAIAEAYLREMRLVFRSCNQHLKNNGYMVVVAANNLFCGMEFYTQSYLCEIAIDEGFSLEIELVDDIKSYGLMTKRNKTAGIISREIVSVFRKVNGN